MAAGGFVAGGSLELSADAPIRPPYRVFLQGGVNRWHTKLVVDEALEALGLQVSN
jgi:cystathionine beta-lyase family protein involved in aluminum resistance